MRIANLCKNSEVRIQNSGEVEGMMEWWGLEVGGALRLRLEAKSRRQKADDRGQQKQFRVSKCGLRIYKRC
jgi:hypothetical protein